MRQVGVTLPALSVALFFCCMVASQQALECTLRLVIYAISCDWLGSDPTLPSQSKVRDVCFLHGYTEPLLLVLHETAPTWPGR